MTQSERSAATRAALLAAARPLLARRGYASVGTPEIAREAGLTRGALYHHFADKRALFEAVVEDVERDLAQRLATTVAERAPADPLAALHIAIDAWLDACRDPEIRQTILIDAPTVLGWNDFRNIAAAHGLGLTEQLLSSSIEAGLLPSFPVTAFAHVLIGALQEAAFATEADAADREAIEQVLHGLVDALATTAATRH